MEPRTLPADPLAGFAPPDPLRRLWGPVTIRVAWELLVHGVRPRPAVLREVREHVLWLLPEQVGLTEAEALATLAVGDWLARAAGTLGPLPVDEDATILPSPGWRAALLRDADPIHATVFRLHYGDGMDLAQLETRSGIAAPLLRAAREAVREGARAVLEEDGVSTEGWSVARLDRMIARVANTSGDVCPGPVGLATDPGRAHAQDCPRCARALRLMRAGVLSPSDLFAPEDGELLPRQGVDLLVVQIHPDARRARGGVLARFEDAARVVNGEFIVVDVARCPDAEARLREVVEQRQPAPDRVRAARRVVRGRWGRKALLGPGPARLLEDVQGLEWGAVEGLAALPEPLPEPPSAARWWMGAVLMALLAAFAAAVAARGAGLPPEVELEATAAVDGGARFDTEDAAYVDVLAVRAGSVSPLLHSTSPADKGAWATGDGAYLVRAEADALVVIAAASPLEDTTAIAAGIGAATGGVDELVRRVRDRYPRAAVAVVAPPR